MDPYLETMIFDECSTTSMAAASRNIARLICNDANNPSFTISRQAVRHTVLKIELE